MPNLLVLPDLREMLVEHDDAGLAQVVSRTAPGDDCRLQRRARRRGDVAALGPRAGRPAGRSLYVLSACQAGRNGDRGGPALDLEVARSDAARRPRRAAAATRSGGGRGPAAAGGEGRPRGHSPAAVVSGRQRRRDDDDGLRVAAARPHGGPGDRRPAQTGLRQRDDLLHLRARREPAHAGIRLVAAPDPRQAVGERSPTSCRPR